MLGRCEYTVFKVCYMFTDRKKDHVLDLFQEVVYNLWRGYGDFRRESCESTWVYRVALNTALMHKRRHRRAPVMVTLDEATYHTLAESAKDELVERLYELIDLLKDEDKELIFLYLDGLTAKEAAEVTGKAESTVKNRLQKIKQELKKMNENEE